MVYKIWHEFRRNLIEKGKQVTKENPDRLSADQLTALTEKILREINGISRELGYPTQKIEIRKPESISEDEQEDLFYEFIDWYDIVHTPNIYLYEYVLKHYPKSKYSQIVCVGDGQNCHLGRKLAMKGYKVISVDPLARKEFSSTERTEDGEGMLRVIKGKFFASSKDLVDWAHLVIGAKVPECVPDLVNLPKPTVFSISADPEIYHMKFKGIPVTSAKKYRKLIKKCPGIRTFTPPPTVKNEDMSNCMIFIHDGIQRERIHEFSE